jgi:hypothetical protein
MRFTYYSEKTVAQCMSALNARLQQKGTASRPGLEGWVEKNGNFSLAVSTPVVLRFSRTTRLRGKVERLGGVTVIKGQVADGLSPRERIVISGALALVGLFIILSGSFIFGAVVVAAAGLLNIPLMGDYQNSEILKDEVRRTLKAKTTPPVIVKRTPESTARATTVKKTAARKPAQKTPASTPSARPKP